MALNPEEVARRVRAARAYAGFEKQGDLGELLKADGLGSTDVGRLERPHGKKKPPEMSPARVESLSRHTGLPPEWFTEEQFGFSEPAEDDRLDRVEQRLVALDAALHRVAAAAMEQDTLAEFRRWLASAQLSEGQGPEAES